MASFWYYVQLFLQHQNTVQIGSSLFLLTTSQNSLLLGILPFRIFLKCHVQTNTSLFALLKYIDDISNLYKYLHVCTLLYWSISSTEKNNNAQCNSEVFLTIHQRATFDVQIHSTLHFCSCHRHQYIERWCRREIVLPLFRLTHLFARAPQKAILLSYIWISKIPKKVSPRWFPSDPLSWKRLIIILNLVFSS